jgi:FtsZ-binding cell division protein ZapB
MGWKKLLKRYAPVALEIGTGDKVQGIADLITAVEESVIKSPHKASVDSVKILAASSQDHQENIEALVRNQESLTELNRALEERLKALEGAKK